MNSELQALFHADQEERTNHPDYGAPEYWALRGSDTERRSVFKAASLSYIMVGCVRGNGDDLHR